MRERAALFRGALDLHASDLHDIITHSREYRNEAHRLWDHYLTLPRDADEDRLAKTAVQKHSDMDAGLDAFSAAILQGNQSQVMEAALANNKLYADYHDASERLKAYQHVAAKNEFDVQIHSFGLFRIVSAASIIVGLAVAVWSYLNLRLAISQPLDEALTHLKHIADGDLTHTAHVMPRDEIVASGSQLVLRAGAVMEETVLAVKRVNDIMEEITSASTEQSRGIEQVNQAISQMDEVTQQNAALVEQAAAASEALKDQAAKLQQAVVTFRMV